MVRNDDFFRDMRRTVHHHVQVPMRRIIGAVLFATGVILAVAILFSCLYTVQSDEEALVLRFGRYIRTDTSGLHFKFPMGIDRIYKERVEQTKTQEFGYRTAEGRMVPDVEAGRESESLMLTADLNAARVHWTVQYRISNLKDYFFRVRDAERHVLRDASEAVIRTLFGDHSIDEVLIIKRGPIADEAKMLLQALMDEYGCGIQIQAVLLKSVDPPHEVQTAFDAVNQAIQKMEKLKNQAEGEKNKKLGPAEGERIRLVHEAEGYRLKRINEAKGDAARFLSLLAEYQKAPEVTRQRLFLESLRWVMPKINHSYVIDLAHLGKLAQLFAAPVSLPEAGK